ncbi:hypothetical protein CYMTET_37583 [Cymbomonas tetramitiformis]|uniref:Uncharacterized protein n=1 Tax=Cymbomonas tetramitiformis TaxID=36881 RepID=A0AAE0CDN6_9CHLO|nr:hypothetical protein CYMTET_37583 [Cymbomonas tetramitiformis]
MYLLVPTTDDVDGIEGLVEELELASASGARLLKKCARVERAAATNKRQKNTSATGPVEAGPSQTRLTADNSLEDAHESTGNGSDEEETTFAIDAFGNTDANQEILCGKSKCA